MMNLCWVLISKEPAMTLTGGQGAGEQLYEKGLEVAMNSELRVNPWCALTAKVVNSSWVI